MDAKPLVSVAEWQCSCHASAACMHGWKWCIKCMHGLKITTMPVQPAFRLGHNPHNLSLQHLLSQEVLNHTASHGTGGAEPQSVSRHRILRGSVTGPSAETQI